LDVNNRARRKNNDMKERIVEYQKREKRRKKEKEK
jgi:hypothetical protein